MKNIEQVVERLNVEFGGGVVLREHIKLHDEYDTPKYVITYQNIIVGSELVDEQFVRNNILEIIRGE